MTITKGQKAFTFLCSTDKVKEAKELLEGINGVHISSHLEKAVRTVPNDQGSYDMIAGNELSGTCTINAMPVIMQALAEKGIAGYSRETMVTFRDIGSSLSEETF